MLSVLVVLRYDIIVQWKALLVSYGPIFVSSRKALACRGKKWLHEIVVYIIC